MIGRRDAKMINPMWVQRSTRGCLKELSGHWTLRPSNLMSVGVLHSRTSLIPLDNFLGAWLVGVIVFVVIFGVTCLQVYNYFTKHCTRDPPFVKVYVVLLLLLDALHLALASHAFYFTTVTNFGDYVRLGIAPWSLLVTIVIGYLSSVQVRSSHAFRIYTISNKQLVVPIIITICAFAELGLGTTFMVKGFHIKAYKNTASQLPYPTSYLSFQVACDVVIAVAMLYYLLKNKSEFQRRTRR
ncbi:hypothetical protein DFH06DRAFT_88285 [Mycena polygramma]|nr:hypothetical protein DFH06DRAFT_88285 [Mycena polygramma]